MVQLLDPIALAALFVSALALFFTIGSFWWLNARRGHVRLLGAPRSFALALTSQTGLYLTLPLALLNDGPTPIALTNIELRGRESRYQGEFVATHKTVYGDEGREFATAIVLEGRQMRLVILEFQGAFEATLTPGTLQFELRGLEDRAGGKASWRALGDFALRIDQKTVEQSGRLVVYDNRPGRG